MPQESVLIIGDRRESVQFLRQNILDPAGYHVSVTQDGQDGVRRALRDRPDLIMIQLAGSGEGGLRVLEELRKAGAQTPVVAMAFRGTEKGAMLAYQLGARQYLVEPFTVEKVQRAVEESLAERRLRTERDHLSKSASAASFEVERRRRELSVLAGIGKSVVSLLDEDRLMGRVVDAAVYLTGAEEGFLLLIDEGSGELHLRAARGINDKTSRQFRLQVGDSLARQVVQTGQPVIVSGADQLDGLQAQNGYPVRPLIHVPLRVGERVLGVLSVDHRTQHRTFTTRDLQLLSTLADSAAIALDHARLRARLGKEPLEREEPVASGSLEEVLNGLHTYRDQVNACIYSARTVLDSLREQAGSLEAHLAEVTLSGHVPGTGPSSRSECEIKAILDSVSDGILVINSEDRIDLANQASLVLLGRSLLGQPVDSVCDDPRWSDTYQTVRAVAQVEGDGASGAFSGATVVVAGASGMVQASFQARPASDHIPAGIVVVLRDIAAEWEMEQAKGSYTASMSQALRGPITSICGYADVLLSESAGLLSDAQQKLVHQVCAQAEQIDAVLGELADVAQLDGDRVQLKNEDVDLTALIHDACRTMRGQMAGRDQIIELNLDPNLPIVRSNGDAMFHILTHLLQNAHRCSPDGARISLRAVKVRAGSEDETALYVAVSVSDQGGGIAPEDRQRVFNRSCRLENPVVPGLGDPGIALPMVKALVEANGGRVWLESTLGVGSTFTVLLGVRSS